MSEHQPPEPEPEPLATTPFELVDETINEATEMDMLVFSIADNVVALINREDGNRKNTFVFRQEKTLSTPDGSRVSLNHYDFFGTKNSPAGKMYEKEYKKERRFAGIDIITPLAVEDEQEIQVMTRTYRIDTNENGTMSLNRLVYDEERDVDVYCDVDENTIAEIAILIQSLRGE